MRVMVKVQIPVERGSTTIADGTLPQVMNNFIEHYKPEAAYFLAEEGERTGMFVLRLDDATEIPSIAEPFFARLGARVTLTPVMTADEMRAGVQKAMKKKA